MIECARYGLVMTVVLAFACSSSTDGTGSQIRGNGGSTSAAGTTNIITGSGGANAGTTSIIVPGGGDANSNGGTSTGGVTGGMSCDGKLSGYIRDFLAANHPISSPSMRRSRIACRARRTRT